MEAINQTKAQLKEMLIGYFKETIPLLKTYTSLCSIAGTLYGLYEGLPYCTIYSADPKKGELVVQKIVSLRKDKPINYKPKDFVKEVGLDVALEVADFLKKEVEKVKVAPTTS